MSADDPEPTGAFDRLGSIAGVELLVQIPPVAQTPGGADAQVSFTIRNTGRRRGTEIAQVYVGRLPTTAVDTPPEQLAGWARATLDPGESQRVTVMLDHRALSYWDTGTHSWVTPTGRVRIRVGASSADTRLSSAITVG